MSLRARYKIDANRVEVGAPIKLPPNKDGSVPCVWLRRVTTAEGEYQNAMDRLMAPHREAQRLDLLPNETLQAVLLEVFAEGAIANWENVLLSDVLDDDNAQGFAEPTPENKKALLRVLPELYNDFRNFAVQRANYLAEAAKGDAKNS